MVKIEQEVRHLPEKEQRFLVDRFVPIVEDLAKTEQGRSDLAAICAAYMREHRPETSVTPEPAASDDQPRDERRDEAPQRRRKRPRRGGGRNRGGSG